MPSSLMPAPNPLIRPAALSSASASAPPSCSSIQEFGSIEPAVEQLARR
jgi:hypothetical protein